MLTKNQIEKFEKKLLAEKADLEDQLKKIDEGLDFGSDTDHFEEEADEAEEFSNRLNTKQILKNRLQDIGRALEKIKTDRYGICEKCGQPVSENVLAAAPESSLCQSCKAGK